MQLMLQQGTDRVHFQVLRSLCLQLDRQQNSWLTMKRREVSLPATPLSFISAFPSSAPSHIHPSSLALELVRLFCELL